MWFVKAEIDVGGAVHAIAFAASSSPRALAATALLFCSEKADALGLAPTLSVGRQICSLYVGMCAGFDISHTER